MMLTYCDGWFRGKGIPGELWTEQQAFKAHQKRKLYAVVVGPPEKPFCFIESNLSAFGVGFLDELKRCYLEYTFSEEDPERLFLEQLTERQFQGNTTDSRYGFHYIYKPSGEVIIHERDVLAHKQHRSTKRVDVSANWEPYPEFGRYDSLIRIHRGLIR